MAEAPKPEAGRYSRLRKAATGRPVNDEERRAIQAEALEGTLVPRIGMHSLGNNYWSNDDALHMGHTIDARSGEIHAIEGDPVAVIVWWKDVTDVLIDGREASISHTAGSGKAATPYTGRTTSRSKMSQSTFMSAMSTITIQRVEGPDMTLPSSLSPSVIRERLATPLADIRRRPQGAASTASRGLADELAKLADLLERGVLSSEEFAAAKARLLTT